MSAKYVCYQAYVVISIWTASSPIPVAARSKVWVCGSSLAGIAGSNPNEAWMSVSCECRVLSGRGLCVGLITRTEESYRLWCVSQCDREAAIMRRLQSTRRRCAMVKKNSLFISWQLLGQSRRYVSTATKHVRCSVLEPFMAIFSSRTTLQARGAVFTVFALTHNSLYNAVCSFTYLHVSPLALFFRSTQARHAPLYFRNAICSLNLSLRYTWKAYREQETSDFKNVRTKQVCSGMIYCIHRVQFINFRQLAATYTICGPFMQLVLAVCVCNTAHVVPRISIWLICTENAGRLDAQYVVYKSSTGKAWMDDGWTITLQPALHKAPSHYCP
jgi:hypothetical protein